MNENPSQPYSPAIDHALERRLDNLPGGNPERYTGFRGSFRLEMDKLFRGMKVKKKTEAPKIKMDEYVKTCRDISELIGEFKRLADQKTCRRASCERHARIKSLAATIEEGLKGFKGNLLKKYEKSLTQAANGTERDGLFRLWETFEYNHQELETMISLTMRDYERFSNSKVDSESKKSLRKLAVHLTSDFMCWQEESIRFRTTIAMNYSGGNS